MKRESVKDKAAFCESILKSIEKQERLVESAGIDVLRIAENMLSYLKDSLQELRKFVSDNKFLDEEEEVEFYKRHLPGILRYFFYYVKLYSLELRLLTLEDSARKKTLKSERKDVDKWVRKNEGFFRYYRSGAISMDKKFYLKGSRDNNLITDPGQWLFDDEFLTVPAYLTGEFLAYERYRIYLDNELKFFDQKSKVNEGVSDDELVWTATRMAAIEILYGLFTGSAFNNGKAQLRQIAKRVEKLTGIDLGNYYRYNIDLKIRKVRNQFLKHMIETSDKYADEQDENRQFK
ncbi:RteC domain-containing protein [Paraflavitalea pollutisoli]|uniref:RteC domain-containing protein n=1 Tax=Paraflavitalea pollutisoli TaxID=3034143 RepID=UPI0023EAB4E6|nr:RteC domain-containing protein [Paraflavitalea sp. H1-2-19X]